MSRKLAIALLCCSALCGAPASAQENDALFVYGSLSCDDWDRYSEFSESALHAWLLDFVVQQNRGYRINILDRLKSAQILRSIDHYCAIHPLDGLAVAAIELMNDLADQAK
jgi:hypothetical protein